jgi:hypothetical protein
MHGWAVVGKGCCGGGKQDASSVVRATRRLLIERGENPAPPFLSQQVSEARGQACPGVAGMGGSSPDKAGTVQVLPDGAGPASVAKGIREEPGFLRSLAAHRAAGKPATWRKDGSVGCTRCEEREILDLLAAGLSTSQVAARLFLAPKTIRNRISAMLPKLGLAAREEAIAYA